MRFLSGLNQSLTLIIGTLEYMKRRRFVSPKVATQTFKVRQLIHTQKVNDKEGRTINDSADLPLPR